MIRKANERGYFDHGWLKTYHTFSFGDYLDPDFMGFRSLRVINEDRVEPNVGFPSHSHRNMEIITYVLEGELAHKDSTGTSSTLHKNELQLMHAGSGITHSEYNPSKTEPVHFYQIWLTPDTQNVTPGYQQMMPKLVPNELVLVASKDGPLKIYQAARVYIAEVTSQLELTIENAAWIQIARGNFALDDTTLLDEGDGVAINNTGTHTLTAKTAGTIILFDF
ncbi:MAG: pirin family protein [Verrucomicrobia bacterium]|nr:pirin family protein [Verrucomicrobiota bacterium]